MVPAELFAAALADSPARPFYTYYDDATDGQAQLSLTTLDNWVAKTANLLQDELDAEKGDRVAIALPTHWLGAVWMLAAWSAGLVVDLDSREGASIVVTDDGGGTVAVGTAPFGGPFAGELSSDVLDYGTEVRAFGDHFSPYDAPSPGDPALRAAGRTYTGQDLVDEATARGLESGARVMTSRNPAGLDGFGDALLAPLAARGSVVLVAHPDPERADVRANEERVTHRL